MKVHHLRIDSEAEGESHVTVWAECYSPDDVEDLIGWLNLARDLMNKWLEAQGTDA